MQQVSRAALPCPSVQAAETLLAELACCATPMGNEGEDLIPVKETSSTGTLLPSPTTHEER